MYELNWKANVKGTTHLTVLFHCKRDLRSYGT